MCIGNAEQKWTMESDGTIQIDGHCLDSANVTPGPSLVVLNPCDGLSSQQWSVGSNHELVNTGATTVNATPYCLDDPGFNATNGTQLGIYSCNGGNNQAWRLPAA